MEILPEINERKTTFLSHVFSSTEEGKTEILNVAQYSLMGVIPIVILNKLIQRFIPDADPDKSSLEIVIELLIQLIVMFCGIILIHRVITYFPTYSGYKYEQLNLISVVLAFLVIILSIQTKIGIKINILYDRIMELWNGTAEDNTRQRVRKNVHIIEPTIQQQHVPSQADFLDTNQPAVYPTISTKQTSGYEGMMTAEPDYTPVGPAAANSLLGSSF